MIFTFIAILGGFEETSAGVKKRGFLTFGRGDENYYHKIKSPTTTLFFTGVKTYPWRHLTAKGEIPHKKYRELKNQGKLPK